MRILKNSLLKDPNLVREKYYLAREYFYRRMWGEAIELLEKYVKESKFRGEIADAYLMKSRCLWQSGRGEEARISCMYSIITNPDFKEALEFMAEMNYEPRKSKWLEYSKLAQNQDVLFVRTKTEKDSNYYNQLFKKDSDMSRYEAIHKKIQEIVVDKSVLDIGCGLATLSEYLPNYSGFDFSEYAIEQNKGMDVWVGNAYESSNYIKKDIYVCTEVLEHLDDLKVLQNIKKGQRLIFSVPSFADPSHLRTYTEESIKELPVDIKDVYRFNWRGKWVLGGEPTSSYILLVDSKKA
jgi:tetratricopeptide (TPR) repeat protein